MTPKELLDEFKKIGIAVTVRGENLSLIYREKDGFDETKVEQMKEDLRAAKQLVIKHLSPYLDEQGYLRMPFECDPKYHWWNNGGQTAKETIRELKERTNA